MIRFTCPLLLVLLTAPMAAPAALAASVATPIRLAIEPPPGASGSEPWVTWMGTALGAVQTVSPDYPVDRLDVKLEAAGSGSGAVVFGRVRRGTPPGLEFYVDPHADLDALNADWRGFHEAAHLLIPFPGNRDIWFTEGLASYYQYLLQARAGVITDEQAWTDLARGFQRGFDDSAGAGRSLRSLSPRMWRLRAFRRVYWTGASFFLNVDVRLRGGFGAGGVSPLLHGAPLLLGCARPDPAARRTLRALDLAAGIRSIDGRAGRTRYRTRLFRIGDRFRRLDGLLRPRPPSSCASPVDCRPRISRTRRARTRSPRSPVNARRPGSRH